MSAPSTRSGRILTGARRNPVTVGAIAGAGLIGSVTAHLVALQPAAEAMGAVFKALGIQAGVVASSVFLLVGLFSWWQNKRADGGDDRLRAVIKAIQDRDEEREERILSMVVGEVQRGQRDLSRKLDQVLEQLSTGQHPRLPRRS